MYVKFSFLIFIPFFFTQISLAQFPDTIFHKDFNQDGYIDTLMYRSDGGSGFFGERVTIIDGSNGSNYFLDGDYCFCSFTSLVQIPLPLLDSTHSSFLNTMKPFVLPKRMQSPGPSLSWIISARLDHSVLKNHPYIDLVINPTLPWTKGKIQKPTTYYTRVKGPIFELFAEKEIKTETEDGFLVYNGHNHSGSVKKRSGENWVKLIGQNGLYRIYQAKHGVIAESNKGFKWLFISDVGLTGAPDKLRWDSVKKVQWEGAFVLIQQKLLTQMIQQTYLVNINSGKVFRTRSTISETNLSPKGLHFVRDGVKGFVSFKELYGASFE